MTSSSNAYVFVVYRVIVTQTTNFLGDYDDYTTTKMVSGHSSESDAVEACYGDDMYYDKVPFYQSKGK